MRTTIEMKAEHRARLLEIAARRGEKGFSNVIAEAIEQYLVGNAERERQREAAQALQGILEPEETDDLEQAARSARESWR